MTTRRVSPCQRRLEQRAGAARGALDLPQRVAAMPLRPAGNGIQGADLRQRHQFVLLHGRDAQLQIVNRGQRPESALAHQLLRHILAQAFDVAQAQPYGRSRARRP